LRRKPIKLLALLLGLPRRLLNLLDKPLDLVGFLKKCSLVFGILLCQFPARDFSLQRLLDRI
jgi:hypothetical protein